MSRHNQDEAEARRIIERVSREADVGVRIGRPSGAAPEGEADDWIEIWGTRIGRGLGAVIVVGLILYLGHLLVQGG